MNKYLKLIFIFFISYVIVHSSYLIAEKYPKVTSTNRAYIFKSKYIPPQQKIVRVELEIADDTQKDFNDIIEVEFNNTKINLLKADAAGNRKRQYFQLKPGRYLIKWKITKDKKTRWPNVESFQKTIIVKETDTYMHIFIHGKKINIS